MKMIRGLWKFPDGRDFLWGKLGFVLMGRAKLNESLIQLSADGQGWITSRLFGLRPNFQPIPPPETPRHSKASLAGSPTGLQSYHLIGASPLPLKLGYLLFFFFLLVESNILTMVVQQLVATLEFTQEKMST